MAGPIFLFQYPIHPFFMSWVKLNNNNNNIVPFLLLSCTQILYTQLYNYVGKTILHMYMYKSIYSKWLLFNKTLKHGVGLLRPVLWHLQACKETISFYIIIYNIYMYISCSSHHVTRTLHSDECEVIHIILGNIPSDLQLA